MLFSVSSIVSFQCLSPTSIHSALHYKLSLNPSSVALLPLCILFIVSASIYLPVPLSLLIIVMFLLTCKRYVRLPLTTFISYSPVIVLFLLIHLLHFSVYGVVFKSLFFLSLHFLITFLSLLFFSRLLYCPIVYTVKVICMEDLYLH